jgi:hypothetical protein
MGNRHHHKKQRARVRAVMAETGESYQQALARLRSDERSSSRAAGDVDLVCVDYFGTRITLATFQILESVSCVVLPSGPFPRLSAFPKNPLFALAGRQTVH